MEAVTRSINGVEVEGVLARKKVPKWKRRLRPRSEGPDACFENAICYQGQSGQ